MESIVHYAIEHRRIPPPPGGPSFQPRRRAGCLGGESYIRKPKVADFESIREDIGHFKMWWKNRVVRVFLIFFFANLGSAAGTFIAGSSIVYKIFG